MTTTTRPQCLWDASGVYACPTTAASKNAKEGFYLGSSSSSSAPVSSSSSSSAAPPAPSCGRHSDCPVGSKCWDAGRGPKCVPCADYGCPEGVGCHATEDCGNGMTCSGPPGQKIGAWMSYEGRVCRPGNGQTSEDDVDPPRPPPREREREKEKEKDDDDDKESLLSRLWDTLRSWLWN